MSTTRVWAPEASTVELVTGGDRHAAARADGGWWEGPALPVGTRYAWSVDGGEPYADPRARRLPDGPEGPAEVVDLRAHDWADGAWQGVQLPGGVVYELHVGTFTTEGTLDAAVEHLDHLVALGVDVVELLPLASFPGRSGWGYDGVGLWAVHEPYGGPYAFQRFVDACHVRGIGVCLDVVYNHLGPSGNHLGDFGPYFTDAHQTPWGSAVNLDDHGSDEVRAWIVDNALGWFTDFHVDALRLDAVHALVDDRAVHVLEEMSAAVDELAVRLGRPLWLVAESDRNDPRTVTTRESGGQGLHAQWADDVHHALHVLLTGETQGYYGDFAAPDALTKVLTGVFLHDGTWSSFRGRTHGAPVDRVRTPGSRFVASLQTHDQIGNRATGDRLAATLDPGTLACGAALLLTAATTPMLFMGEEWGASTPWAYFTDHTDPELAEAVRTGRRNEFASHGWDREDVPDPQDPATVVASTLRWDEVGQQPHAGLLDFYTRLVALRRARPDLRDPRLDRVVVHHDVAARTVVVERGEHRVAVNLAAEPVTLDLRAGDRTLVVLLASDDDAAAADGRAVVLPPRSAAVLGPA